MVCLQAIPFLRLEEKDEREVLRILKKIKYEPQICVAALTFLKKEKNVMRIIKKSGYVPEVCQAAISSLNLGNKSESKIMSILNQVKYDLAICEASISYLKKESNLLKILKKNGYNKRLVTVVMKRLETLK